MSATSLGATRMSASTKSKTYAVQPLGQLLDHLDRRCRRPQFPNNVTLESRMRWVHRYRRHGAYLALLALALQIVLSFDHVDLGGIIGPTHLTLTGKQNTVVTQAAQPGPVQTSGDGDSYCPICASIFLVSNSFVSEPPKLPVPDRFERTVHSIKIDRGISTPPSIVFRSRAPPAA
jgi:hypothetical protein